MRRLYFLGFLLATWTFLLCGCSGASVRGSVASSSPSADTSSNSQPFNTSRQIGASPILPDPRLTPGDTLDVTRADICVPGYTKKVRDVPQAVKRQAYASYGINSREPGEYEVDHLISLELGGSNSLKNLWPESYRTEPWNAHVKDKVENRLHRMICSDEIDIKVAQAEIASDWIAAYKKYVGPEPGGSVSSTTKKVAGPPAETRSNGSLTQTAVIIGNRRSHIYHKLGCSDYNRVSPQNRVIFQTAAQAEAAGYRAARNCSP